MTTNAVLIIGKLLCSTYRQVYNFTSVPSSFLPPSPSLLSMGLKLVTSGLKPCNPLQQPTQLRPCAPSLHSLFQMILIDSFIDCKEIGCSYNTAGLFRVMKKGMWPRVCCRDGERGRVPCQLHGWQLSILIERFGLIAVQETWRLKLLIQNAIKLHVL